MSAQKLPKALEREPLVDAIFEVRLDSNAVLTELLPGYLFHALDPKPVINRLPALEIPQQMRAQDPNMQFFPLLTLEWGQFVIAVGDFSFALSCKLPYPKWPSFRAGILQIVKLVAALGIPNRVFRYSLKYVNIIPAETVAEQLSKIKIKLDIGPISLSDEQINVRIHKNYSDNILHIISIISGAQGNLNDGRSVSGTVLDIDSVRLVTMVELPEFVADFEGHLDSLRASNKEMFFGCLTEEAIQEMGPVYE